MKIQSFEDLEAKFWLRPVALARNYGFAAPELNRVATLVEKHQVELLKAWHPIHG